MYAAAWYLDVGPGADAQWQYYRAFSRDTVYKGFMVKLLRADGGCLGTRRR